MPAQTIVPRQILLDTNDQPLLCTTVVDIREEAGRAIGRVQIGPELFLVVRVAPATWVVVNI